jgi:hypothetical protein
VTQSILSGGRRLFAPAAVEDQWKANQDGPVRSSQRPATFRGMDAKFWIAVYAAVVATGAMGWNVAGYLLARGHITLLYRPRVLRPRDA